LAASTAARASLITSRPASVASTPLACRSNSPVRANLSASSGSQPGDPAKAADAILRALTSDKTPLRLALGNDAADMIAAYLDGSRAEFSEWEHITRSTDYEAW
jgi:hypothetical protein